MATITIRNLPDETVSILKHRANSNGRSMEEEARACLRNNYAPVADVLREIADIRRHQTRPVSPQEIEAWIQEGRD